MPPAEMIDLPRRASPRAVRFSGGARPVRSASSRSIGRAERRRSPVQPALAFQKPRRVPGRNSRRRPAAGRGVHQRRCHSDAIRRSADAPLNGISHPLFIKDGKQCSRSLTISRGRTAGNLEQTSTCYGQDGPVAQNPSQMCNLHSQSVPAHHDVGPDCRANLVPTDHTVALDDHKVLQIKNHANCMKGPAPA